jgi:RNA polymerase primary sigma factor
MDSSLIAKGKDQGYLLSEDVAAAFSRADDAPDTLEDFYSALVAEGIDVVDHRPVAPIVAPARRTRKPARRNDAEDAIASSVGDSVRLYLQEIGETDLLTMEEEVWLSTRMERGLMAVTRMEETGLTAAERADLNRRFELLAVKIRWQRSDWDRR